MTLLDFVQKFDYKTDKIPLGYIHEFYSSYFSDMKDSTKNLLEIGISNGHSLLLWRDYFQNATIHGVDIEFSNEVAQQDRIIQSITDAYKAPFFSQLRDNYYDIIIDDGPHTYDSMVIFLSQYFPKLVRGGIMVLEDIVTVGWCDRLLGLLDKSQCTVEVFDMRNKQRSFALNEQWKHGLDVMVIRKNP